MIFPHQIALFNQFYITLPAACLLDSHVMEMAAAMFGFPTPTVIGNGENVSIVAVPVK